MQTRRNIAPAFSDRYSTSYIKSKTTTLSSSAVRKLEKKYQLGMIRKGYWMHQRWLLPFSFLSFFLGKMIASCNQTYQIHATNHIRKVQIRRFKAQNTYGHEDVTLVQGHFSFSSIKAGTLFALRVLITNLQQFQLESSVCIPFSHNKYELWVVNCDRRN